MSPNDFIQIAHIEDGKAINKMKLKDGDLRIASWGDLMKMPLREAERAPIIIAKGEAAEWIKKYL